MTASELTSALGPSPSVPASSRHTLAFPGVKKGFWQSLGGIELLPFLDESRESAGLLFPGEKGGFLKPGCWPGHPFVFPGPWKKDGPEGLAGNKPGWRDTRDRSRKQPEGLFSDSASFPGQRGQRGLGRGSAQQRACSWHSPPPLHGHSRVGMARGEGGCWGLP